MVGDTHGVENAAPGRLRGCQIGVPVEVEVTRAAERPRRCADGGQRQLAELARVVAVGDPSLDGVSESHAQNLPQVGQSNRPDRAKATVWWALGYVAIMNALVGGAVAPGGVNSGAGRAARRRSERRPTGRTA